MNLFDTVAAVSTPRGKGGVAMIRISGEDAIDIAARMFLPKSGRSLCEYRSSSAIYGDILSGKPERDVIDGYQRLHISQPVVVVDYYRYRLGIHYRSAKTPITHMAENYSRTAQ